MSLRILFIVFCVAVTAVAGDAERIEFFAFGGVGFAGTTSQGELKYRKLMKSSDPLAAFSDWYESATPAGKAYCLVAFHELDLEKYDKEKTAILKKNHQPVSTMSGCMVMEQEWKAIFEKIESGAYKPFQSDLSEDTSTTQ